MLRFITDIPIHFREAFQGLVRNLVMTMSAATSVTVTLVLTAIFLLVGVNVQDFTTNIEEDIRIFVKIENQLDLAGITQLQNQIKVIDGVETVEFSSKDDQLERYIEHYGDGGSFFGNYRGETNPLKNVFYVYVKNGNYLNNVAKKIEEFKGIELVSFGGESSLEIVKAFNQIRYWGFALVGALSLLAIFLISNTIKLTIFSRVDEIFIMKSVGATNGYIRTPFLLSGIIIGILGAVLPIGLMIFGYTYLYDMMGGIFFSNMFPLRSPMPFLLELSQMILLASMAVGLIGSYISVTRYLRLKR